MNFATFERNAKQTSRSCVFFFPMECDHAEQEISLLKGIPKQKVVWSGDLSFERNTKTQGSLIGIVLYTSIYVIFRWRILSSSVYLRNLIGYYTMYRLFRQTIWDMDYFGVNFVIRYVVIKGSKPVLQVKLFKHVGVL